MLLNQIKKLKNKIITIKFFVSHIYNYYLLEINNLYNN